MSSAPMVPYGAPATPAVTPPGSFTQGDQPQIGQQPVPGGWQDPEQLKKTLGMLLAKQSQPSLAAPVPSPIPEPKQQSQAGSGPGWGFERFANQIGGHIQQAVAQEKKTQLAKAESDWTQMISAMQSNNPTALNAVMSDPKKLKNMAKALNQDWLNPEKTNVYRDALNNVMKQQQAKGKAAQGLQSLMKKLIGKAQNPQLTDEQKQAIAREVMSKAPLTQAPLDKESMSILNEEMNAQNASDLESQKEDASAKKQKDEQEFQSYRQEVTQQHQDWRTQNQQQFSEHMERLRETAAEQRQASQQAATFKALGIRLSDSDKKAMEVKPSQINSEINGTLTSMRQQLSQASSELKTMQGQAQKRDSSLWQRVISDSPDVKGAQSQVDNLKAAVDYIEKNRSAIISGKASMDDVVDKAQSISSGTPPGFK